MFTTSKLYKNKLKAYHDLTLKEISTTKMLTDKPRMVMLTGSLCRLGDPELGTTIKLFFNSIECDTVDSKHTA